MIIKISLIVLLGLSVSLVSGQHLTNYYDYVIHPFDWHDHDVYDYQMITVWIPSESSDVCRFGYTLDEKGACTFTELHFDIWPLRLLLVMPDWCPYDYCVDERGIWMKSGSQQEYLWKAIKEADEIGRVAIATSVLPSE